MLHKYVHGYAASFAKLKYCSCCSNEVNSIYLYMMWNTLQQNVCRIRTLLGEYIVECYYCIIIIGLGQYLQLDCMFSYCNYLNADWFDEINFKHLYQLMISDKWRHLHASIDVFNFMLIGYLSIKHCGLFCNYTLQFKSRHLLSIV